MITTETSEERIYHKGLSRNILLLSVTVSLAPLFLIGMLILYECRIAYRSKIIDHFDELIHRHTMNIDRFLIDRLGDIRVLARTFPLDELSSEPLLRKRLAVIREEYGAFFVDLGLIDSKGIQQAYAGPFNLTKANYASAKWFQRARQSESFISDVFTGLRGTPHFIVTVKKPWQGEDWLIRATVDFEAFKALVESIKIGQTGFAFILNRLGEFQTKPGFEVILNRGPYFELLQGRIDTTHLTILERPDALGRESIFVFAPLKSHEWILCCQQESSDAFANLNQAQRMAVVIILVSGMVIVLVSILLSRQMAARVALADEQKALMDEKVIETGRLASIGEMAAGVAHEINNPVAIMVEEAGWIEDLLEEDPLTEESLAEIRRASMQIRTQGGRCKDITYKLLSFARKTDSHVQSLNINTVVEDVIDLLKQKSRFADIMIKAELDRSLPKVSAPPSELQQVVLNLVNNSIDAIGQGGGTVTVRTRREAQVVLLEVSDTGQGIPEAYLNRIFDPFFTTKPVGQGTGLGLSICHGIISKLGGDISVFSEVGQGSTFIMSLPASADSGMAETNHNQGPTVPSDGRTSSGEEET